LRRYTVGESGVFESAEWVNGGLGKIWRFYRHRLNKLIRELTQQAIEEALEGQRPPYLKSIDVVSLEIGERAAWIRSVEGLPTKSETDVSYHVDVRYDGDASLLLNLNLGAGPVHFMSVAVEVSSLDLDAKLWVRGRLIDREPFLGDLSFALVSPPRLNIKLKPFRLFNAMELPGARRFLRNLFKVEIPALFTLPLKVDVANFASNEELDAQDLSSSEHLNEFPGILSITLYEGRNLTGTTSLDLSNPFCIIRVGEYSTRSKSHVPSDKSSRGNPVWNQHFDLPVRHKDSCVLRVEIADRYGLEYRTIGVFSMGLGDLMEDEIVDYWAPLEDAVGSKGRLHIRCMYRKFVVHNLYTDSDMEDAA